MYTNRRRFLIAASVGLTLVFMLLFVMAQSRVLYACLPLTLNLDLYPWVLAGREDGGFKIEADRIEGSGFMIFIGADDINTESGSITWTPLMIKIWMQQSTIQNMKITKAMTLGKLPANILELAGVKNAVKMKIVVAADNPVRVSGMVTKATRVKSTLTDLNLITIKRAGQDDLIISEVEELQTAADMVGVDEATEVIPPVSTPAIDISILESPDPDREETEPAADPDPIEGKGDKDSIEEHSNESPLSKNDVRFYTTIEPQPNSKNGEANQPRSAGETVDLATASLPAALKQIPKTSQAVLNLTDKLDRSLEGDTNQEPSEHTPEGSDNGEEPTNEVFGYEQSGRFGMAEPDQEKAAESGGELNAQSETPKLGIDMAIGGGSLVEAEVLNDLDVEFMNVTLENVELTAHNLETDSLSIPGLKMYLEFYDDQGNLVYSTQGENSSPYFYTRNNGEGIIDNLGLSIEGLINLIEDHEQERTQITLPLAEPVAEEPGMATGSDGTDDPEPVSLPGEDDNNHDDPSSTPAGDDTEGEGNGSTGDEDETDDENSTSPSGSVGGGDNAPDPTPASGNESETYTSPENRHDQNNDSTAAPEKEETTSALPESGDEGPYKSETTSGNDIAQQDAYLASPGENGRKVDSSYGPSESGGEDKSNTSGDYGARDTVVSQEVAAKAWLGEE